MLEIVPGIPLRAVRSSPLRRTHPRGAEAREEPTAVLAGSDGEGAPSRPEAIIYGVAVAVGLVDKKTAPVQFKQLEMPIPRYHPSDLRGSGEMVVYKKAEKV